MLVNVSTTNGSIETTTPTPGQNLPMLPVVMMLVFGGTGNIIAISLLTYTSRKHQWGTFYRLVLSLAISDLVGLAGPLPISIAAYANNKKWEGGQALCDFMSFTLIFAGMASAMLAAAMSFDRFLAVWFPFFYSRLSKRRTNITILCLWMLAFLIACMPLVGINENIHQFPGTWCFFNMFATEAGHMLFSYLYACMGIAMVGMLVVLNTSVIVVLARRCLQTRSKHGVSTVPKDSGVYNVVFLVVLMTAFTICWLPLMVRIIINQSSLGEVDRASDLLAMRLALTNQILDPWIYIILRKDSITKIINIGKRVISPCCSFSSRLSTTECNSGMGTMSTEGTVSDRNTEPGVSSSNDEDKGL